MFSSLQCVFAFVLGMNCLVRDSLPSVWIDWINFRMNFLIRIHDRFLNKFLIHRTLFCFLVLIRRFPRPNPQILRKIENRYEELQIRANSADSCQKQSWFSKFILKSFWKLKKLLTGYKPFITGYCILGVTITTNVTYIPFWIKNIMDEICTISHK